MSTQAQISANQANAQHSTGPVTESGKAVSCLNNMKFGLTGSTFSVLPWEDEEDYETLLAALRASLSPHSPFERMLVEKMAQHQWLSRRALLLQEICFNRDLPICDSEEKLALYLRYQTTHERAYQKYFDQLVKLRSEARKTQLHEIALQKAEAARQIGFESQEHKRKEEERKQAEETRRQEAHAARVRLTNARAAESELDTDIRSTIEARLPGHTEIPFDRLKSVLTLALEDVARNMAAEKAAA